LLTLAALFWAGNTVLARGMSETVPPIALAWSRWVIATLILLPFAMPHLRTDWPRVADNWKMLAFLAAMGAGSYNTLHYIGLNATPALNALVIGAAGPMLIALASFLAFRDKLGSGQTIGIALAAVGVLIIVAKGNPSNLAAANFNSGDLWIFAAIASWAVYTAYLRKKPPIHWLSFSLVTFALAAVYNFPLFIAETIAGRQLQATWQTAATIGYVSVFPSVLSYIFFNRGVELIGSNRAGAYIYLIPVFGSALAVMLLGEQFRWHHAAAFGLVMGGVALAAKRG
jgi:drug/metabolite transporter (DMT)-like permease